MRASVYAGASVALAVGVVANAFNQRPNFYSASVYLAQSNLSALVLLNFCLVLTVATLWALSRTFYGQLRPVEAEQLAERGWFAITETALAMTIFRDEIGVWFMVMFVALMSGRIWGWIGYSRVEILDQQPPASPRLFHTRLTASLVLSLVFDFWMTRYTLTNVIQQARPNMMVMFLFEFALLTASSITTTLRYGLSVVDARIQSKQKQELLEARRAEIRDQREEILRQRAANSDAENTDAGMEELPNEDDIDEMDVEPPGWEEKGQWILSLDLLSDFVRLSIYLAFFIVIATFFGLPIHIMRDLFMTARSFIKRLNAFLKYRNATKDMNSKFADATAEEIQREDTCIICREVMRPWAATNAETPAANAGGAGAGRRMVRAAQTNERLRPKKLPCGHVLHLGCLKSWLERQQFCPTCRRPVIERSSTVNNPAPIPAQPQVQAAANAAREAIPAAPRERAPQPQIVINREINIGPLRLAFGRGVLPAGVAVPNAPQARVIGLGVEAGPARRNVPRPSPAGTHAHQQPHSESGGADDVSIEANIRRLERQINDEASRLDLHRSELAILRQLQEELTRLRTTRIMSGVGHMIPETAGIYGAAYAQPSQSGGGPFVGSQGRLVPSVRGLGGVRTITTHRFAPIPGQVAIPSGSPDLPPGVAIPSGWNLLPLQNADATERNVSSSTPVVRTSMSTSTVPPNTTETSGVALAAATVSSATTGPDQAASSVQCPESQPEQELISDPAAQGTQPEQASDTATQENSPAVPSAENAPTDQSTAPADDDDDMFQNWGSSPPLPRTAGVDSGMSTPAVAAIPEPVRFDFGNINNNVSSGADATPSGEGQRSSSGINEADLPVLPRTEGIDDGMSTPGSFRMPLRSSPEESRNKGKGKEKQPSVEDDNEARGSGR